MLFQTTGFVCFVALHVPTDEMEFECVRKDVEHENRIIVLIFHLFGDFAIDRSNECCVLKQGMPIRLFQEGRASGSRAELESFTDIAVTIMESRNHILATAIQDQIVNHLTLINFGIDDLVQIQVGNVKQSQKFFDRHPTLDPNQNQEQMDELQEEYYDDDMGGGNEEDENEHQEYEE